MSDQPADTFLRIADGPEATTKIKGSRFTGQALSVHSLDEALARLETIRKRYHDATHHCWAAIWGPPESTDERFDDDGEPSGSAGRPILHHQRIGPSPPDGICDPNREEQIGLQHHHGNPKALSHAHLHIPRSRATRTS